jgi:uncharacterized protein YndB with AHSA1/START domain
MAVTVPDSAAVNGGSTMISSGDRIHVVYPLLASPGQVWDAISDAATFGIWFGAELDGQFAAHANLAGKLVPTNSHPGLGRAQQPYLGSTVTISMHRIDPPRMLSFRWQPVATPSGESYPAEPVTLVSFELDEIAGGTRLTITESGAIAGQQWTDQAVSHCLWRPRELAMLVEKFLSGARDLRRAQHQE